MFSLAAVLLKLMKTTGKSMSSSSAIPQVLFVLGGPGAGKGTQCLNLVRDYKFVHLSAGDLLRAERNSGSKDGDLIQTYIKEGKIVPVEITVRLLEKAMNLNENSRFLIDGFPRNENNLSGWRNHMNGKADVKGVLFFECSEEICIQRILERGKTSGRVDDNEESLRKRFQTFYNETMPVITYYKQRDLVMSVDAIAEPDQVYERVRAIIDQL